MKRYGGPSSAALARQVVAFRVRPARWMPSHLLPAALTHRLYWIVRVFEDAEAARAFHVWRCLEPATDFEGEVVPLPVIRFPKRKRGGKRRPPHLLPRQGELLLHRGWIGTEVIAHEAVHLATSTLRALADLSSADAGLVALGEEIDDNEERLAYLAGIFARLVTDGLWAHGLVPAAAGSAP